MVIVVFTIIISNKKEEHLPSFYCVPSNTGNTILQGSVSIIPILPLESLILEKRLFPSSAGKWQSPDSETLQYA